MAEEPTNGEIDLSHRQIRGGTWTEGCQMVHADAHLFLFLAQVLDQKERGTSGVST